VLRGFVISSRKQDSGHRALFMSMKLTQSAGNDLESKIINYMLSVNVMEILWCGSSDMKYILMMKLEEWLKTEKDVEPVHAADNN